MKISNIIVTIGVLLFLVPSIYPVSLKISQLSLTTPTIINESSTVLLDTTITITQHCELLKAGPNFNKLNAIITFTTLKNHKIIVKQGAILDLSSFAHPSQSLIFKGAASVLLEPGSEIYFFDHILSKNEKNEYAILEYN